SVISRYRPTLNRLSGGSTYQRRYDFSIARSSLDGGGPHGRSRRRAMLAMRRPDLVRRPGGPLPALPPVRHAGRRGGPLYADAHQNSGLALMKQGTRAEATPEFRAARDPAPPGSALARPMERVLAESDHQADRRDRRSFRSAP